jgi:hypothetical protein
MYTIERSKYINDISCEVKKAPFYNERNYDILLNKEVVIIFFVENYCNSIFWTKIQLIIGDYNIKV